MTHTAREARRLRRAELALRALGEFGNPKAAADHLGIAETTLRTRVADYCALMGYQTPVQAAFWMDPVENTAKSAGDGAGARNR